MSENCLKQTYLFTEHKNRGARFSPFGGWDMPLHYGSQLQEHNCVRQNAGLFDVSHMCCLDIEGPDAIQFIDHMFSNDITTSRDGRATYGCLMNSTGGIIDDLIVYRLSTHHVILVVNASRAQKDTSWLEEHLSSFDCNMSRREDVCILSLQGPNSGQIILSLDDEYWKLLKQAESLAPFSCALHENIFVARTGYTGEDGFEVVLPNMLGHKLWNDLCEQGAVPCGLGARDTLRLEAGLNLYGQDMDEDIFPKECGIAWTVNTENPDRLFIGKEAFVKRVPRFKRIGILLKSPGVLRHGQTFSTAHGEGYITSGGFSPTMRKGIGIARVPCEIAVGDTGQINIRQKITNVVFCNLPFVRRGQIVVPTEIFKE